MHSRLNQRACEYFQQHLGVSLDALLDPIDSSMPAGKPVRGNGVYNAIEQARRQHAGNGEAVRRSAGRMRQGNGRCPVRPAAA